MKFPQSACFIIYIKSGRKYGLIGMASTTPAKLSQKMAKHAKKMNKKAEATITKLNRAIEIKNIHGLIGVAPILFKIEEFLNSKTVWGIKTNRVDNVGIAKAPGIMYSGPIILPINNTKSNGIP